MRKTGILSYLLICLAVLVTTSCVPGFALLPTPTMVPTMLPTSSPTKIITPTDVTSPSPTVPIDTATPTVSATDVPQRCTNPLQTVYVNDLIFTEPADRDGWCKVKLPLIGYKTIGYTLIYPEDWIVTLAGAEGMNLLFDTERGQRVFVQLTTTELPLERADEATYGFEMAGPEPLVAPDESQISKAIQNIGDKRVLVLLTSKGDISIRRYFLLHNGTLYMFEIKVPKVDLDTDEIVELVADVEEMVASVQFAR